MNDRRRIILHAGLPKTGTTSIQTALYAHRERLLEEFRLLYPSLSPNLTTPLCTLFQGDPARHIENKLTGVTTPQAIASRQREYRDTLESEILSTNWDTLLLSAEGVSNLHVKEIARLRQWGDQFTSRWTVLFCVRHPIAFVRSHIQEILKGGATLAQLCTHPPRPAYRGKLSNLITQFGRENVIVYDFESATNARGGVVGAFVNRLGLPTSIRDLLSAENVRENPSLSHEATLLLDSVNRQRPMFDGDARAPRRSGRELQYICRIRGGEFDIPVSLKEKIREITRDDIEWINTEFGLDLYRDVIELRETSPATAQAETPSSSLSQETLDDIAAVIAELVTTASFLHALNEGRTALSQGDDVMARRRFLEAARLDPDALPPKAWLARLDRRKERG